MRFRTRTIVLAALAAVFVGLLGATAFAGEADVSGQGRLAARGKGSVTVDMGGTFRMEVAGDVEIRDLAGDMTVRIDGAATRSTGTTIELEDFRGRLIVEGSHFVVHATGKGRFVAHGHGFAHLEGRGVYKTRDGELHRWNGDVEVELAA